MRNSSGQLVGIVATATVALGALYLLVPARPPWLSRTLLPVATVLYAFCIWGFVITAVVSVGAWLGARSGEGPPPKFRRRDDERSGPLAESRARRFEVALSYSGDQTENVTDIYRALVLKYRGSASFLGLPTVSRYDAPPCPTTTRSSTWKFAWPTRNG